MDGLVEINKGYKDRVATTAANFNPGGRNPTKIVHGQQKIAQQTKYPSAASEAGSTALKGLGGAAAGYGIFRMMKRQAAQEAAVVAAKRRKKLVAGGVAAAATGAYAPAYLKNRKEAR